MQHVLLKLSDLVPPCKYQYVHNPAKRRSIIKCPYRFSGLIYAAIKWKKRWQLWMYDEILLPGGIGIAEEEMVGIKCQFPTWGTA